MPDSNSQPNIGDLRAGTAVVAETLTARDININAPVQPPKARNSPQKLPSLTDKFVGRVGTLNSISSFFRNRVVLES
jgi:hypothetical protein